MEFSPGATVLSAGNGFGKSALIKSLYDTLGAEPHRIDESWRRARVTSAVDFEVAGEAYTAMKIASTYVVFDAAGQKILQTTSVTRELSPFMADLLDFRLLMTDKREQVLIPPPAYAFAPFCIDQDKSWSEPWKPFRGMYLPSSDASLAEYHSGLKPNAYYVARAERDRLAVELREEAARLQGLRDALEQIRSVQPEAGVYFDLKDFEAETNSLLAECSELLDRQNAHRAKLSELIDARALWSTQIDIAKAALAELDEVFKSAIGHPADVECPTCGEHYTNDIAGRFGIAADTEALISILHQAKEQKDGLQKQIDTAQKELGEVETALSRVKAILSTRKNDVTLEEVMAAEGRNAASRVLRERVTEIESKVGALSGRIEELRLAMRKSLDRKRSATITDFFFSRLTSFSMSLDVRVESTKSGSIASAHLARGSEGPRGLTAYFYAFLHTAKEYGSSTFCPIVIDAPNQQGQDGQHLPAIISFLVKKRPENAQLILGVEDAVGITADDADITSVGVQKRQLLDDNQFAAVSEHLRPYLAQLVL
ncbi:MULTISPECIES: ATP-binding protein [unclassified Bradyrhizobium]|uniref:ATP-binding protein n=1 Tax=unclassified Bradyrhizobium TaxID=2631580 RepID=UPI001FF85566|nr:MULTISPECIES: ATP-binding protein [unclassified Bradyrhizobium]MCK1422623.1 hypothetical protein [Bradyrhizobium sp. CW12]MCK1644678.1 hypothetical protein [Bradyrhizobium sp. 154]